MFPFPDFGSSFLRFSQDFLDLSTTKAPHVGNVKCIDDTVPYCTCSVLVQKRAKNGGRYSSLVAIYIWKSGSRSVFHWWYCLNRSTKQAKSWGIDERRTWCCSVLVALDRECQETLPWLESPAFSFAFGFPCLMLFGVLFILLPSYCLDLRCNPSFEAKSTEDAPGEPKQEKTETKVPWRHWRFHWKGWYVTSEFSYVLITRNMHFF